ncbi:cytochrome bo3 quinol oxidase subunit 2 [Pleomorphomonas diazotrophica]|uniref:ubiquinol oxidase subunit II n=1 Tax=Pleomorphomonas diazotrophica TaxID=1166257 RepID=UPI0008E32D0B|nr:ubiquinol oxidase subunit II [Pleomorphomonas diazotrophica]SFM91971.1 cytochrome bo3 quinol oxidase subunit 2 [Pleomorphomonas diazotrophica]
MPVSQRLSFLTSRLARLRPALIVLGTGLLLAACSSVILEPAGPIAAKEKQLILISTALMLLVVLPVIILTLFFAIWYRASNTRAHAMPNWAHSNAIEVVVWTVPALIVLALGWLAWTTTHALDPYRPLEETGKPTLEIDVVALDWKWLFIYPEQNIASVNEVAFPIDRPVHFEITSDTVMNSFFIPGLAGQMYAMAGMRTELSLIANRPGTFGGLSANYSGAGFSGMRFTALATSDEEFDAWTRKVAAAGRPLDETAYAELAKTRENSPVVYYAPGDPNLLVNLIKKYRHTPPPEPTGDKGADQVSETPPAAHADH